MASVRDFLFTLQSALNGHGPDITVLNIPGMMVVAVASIIVVYSFYRAVKVSIWPHEEDQEHIKNRILKEDEDCAH
ncbi:MAG: hypothetical protein ACI95C_000162 [Pseudohongiellaceae bacterium]|jgi:hypothetical protein